MTRFARAKGSKASNERVVEASTPWSEMKQDLLHKNEEEKEKHLREEALQKRNANYQAFLKEKEEEESLQTSWADFSEKYADTKRKLSLCNGKSNPIQATKRRIVGDVGDRTHQLLSDDSDEEFTELRSKIDLALRKQPNWKADNESDSDAPPEEISVKEKPQEIIVKKNKKPKRVLKISVEKSEVSNQKNDTFTKAERSIKKKKLFGKFESRNKRDSDVTEEITTNNKPEEIIVKKTKKSKQKMQMTLEESTQNGEKVDMLHNKKNINDLTDVDKRRIAKKYDRYRKQLAKKKLKRLEKKSKKTNDVNGKKQNESEQPINSALEDKISSPKKDNLTEKDLEKINKKKERRVKQVEKKKRFKELKKLEEINSKQGEIKNVETRGPTNQTMSNNQFENNKSFQRSFNNKKEKKFKNKDNSNHTRRKPTPETVMINGKSIDIDYVNGFPVKKEDADRLKQLRKEMISKGLPRSDIDVALKLERRRAEKALAREKKNVCFNCRKSGHMLSECPEIGNDQLAQSSGTGICFKCGSTEHSHFECKVVKGMDYKFAQCFICNEQGHIARQCPDNNRGLYPKGGSCNVCGDITHLKKDCPKYQQQQSQMKNFSMGTMDTNNPDALDTSESNKYSGITKKRPNKIIQFY